MSERYILMHKEIPVASVDMDEDGVIERILGVHDRAHLPVGIRIRADVPELTLLRRWWRGRAIPTSRDGLRDALNTMGLTTSEALVTKSFGLSLSDQYWMKPQGVELTWKDINFFEHTFSGDVGDALFGQARKESIDLMSPCNTSDGWLRKKWAIAEGKRVLLKGGSGTLQQEPINEVFGSALHDALGCESYTTYKLIWEGNKPFSICDDFISKDTELISGAAIYTVKEKANHHSDYQHFLRCCDTLGIKGMRQHLDYVLTFDFLIGNTDRHLGNLGVIRSAGTLEWINPAPVFDSGTSLWHNVATEEIKPFRDIESKPFQKLHSLQIKLVSDLSWVDMKKVRVLGETLPDIFASSAKIGLGRAQKLREGFLGRVSLLEREIERRMNISLQR